MDPHRKYPHFTFYLHFVCFDLILYVPSTIFQLTFYLDPENMVTQNVTQLLLHHVAYSDTKFEVAMPNGLGGDAFKRKDIH